MDDKTFELLEKMYSEFKTELSEFKTELSELKAGQKKLESGQARIEVVLEHDIKPSLQALHERAAANTAKLEEHDKRLETIENKVDYIAMSVTSQNKRLKVVESSGKKAK